MTTAFYGKPPTRSYFVGCSDGGREALMEAQRFPEDFDGIIAGAPANDWSHLFTSFVWNELALSRERIPLEKLPTIQRAIVAACDDADGLKDGLVSNPPACRFDPAVLACKGTDGKDCLTSAQADTLKALYCGTEESAYGRTDFRRTGDVRNRSDADELACLGSWRIAGSERSGRFRHFVFP